MVPKTIGDVFMNRTYFETVRTGNDRIALQKIFFALSRQTGCPEAATNKYFNLIMHGIEHEGAGYLKILAALPILGLRVLGNDMPQAGDFRLKVRSRTGFPKLFAWHFQELHKYSELEPTTGNVLSVRRILTLLAIGNMLKMSSPRRLKRERLNYAEKSIKRLNYATIAMYRETLTDEIQAFLKFVRYRGRDDTRLRNDHGLNPVKGKVTLDPGCFSLKSLAKRTLNKSIYNEVPEAVSTGLMHRSILDVTKGLQPRATALARRTIPDGKQTVLVEYGGKFRGITSYYSPLIHASSTYGALRQLLDGWIPDCSLDQQVGHRRIIKLFKSSGERLPIVSADATAFTDSIDVNLAHVMLEALGEDGFLEYITDISIATEIGIISTCLPLMGIKGCFELGCVMLAFGLWRERNKRYGLKRRRNLLLTGSAHCCDDFCGRATLESVQNAYKSIGCELNYKKTVVSHTTAVFCGEFVWKGEIVTPIRLKITDLLHAQSGTIVLPMVRMFLDRCKPVWGRAAMRCVEPYIMSACNRTVGPQNVNYALPTKLGGVPIPRKYGTGLLEVLSKRRNLLYALYNTPIVKEQQDITTSMVGLVRLGSPVKQPDGTILPSVTLPTIGRNGWKQRKTLVQQMVQRGQLSVTDVLEYYTSV
jgi:hypothetical protein